MPNNAPKTHTKKINLRIPPDLLQTLSNNAWQSRQTLSAYIRNILTDHLKQKQNHARQAVNS